jgi:sulfoxide reductase heme-binding subunit YedZ
VTPHFSDRTIRFVIKPVVGAACLLPVFLSVGDALTHRPGNPYNAIVRSTGYWSLRFLFATMAITPVRWLTRWHALIKFRRLLGLFAFFYGAVHFAVYFFFDRISGVSGADHLAPLVVLARATWATSLEVVERPFFAIGFVALALLVPLAATSSAGMIRTIGGQRWRTVHRLIYPASIASVIHTYWPWTSGPLPYAVILVVILAVRVARGVATGALTSVGPSARRAVTRVRFR